jgi:hypothetical protein
MKKQTAVQWLFDEFIKPENQRSLASLFLKAIEMEKHQIEDAYESGVWDVGCRNADSKKYYKENYGNK